MKKHRTVALVAVIVLAVIVGIVIAVSKKSVEKQAPTPPSLAEPRATSSHKEEDLAPTTTVKTFTMAEVATHNSRSSCYVAISGSVYDLTLWIEQNPDGQFPVLALCGKDGTDKVTTETELASFKIGTLVQ